MRVFLMVLILGLTLKFAYPFFLGEKRTTRRRVYQRPTFSSLVNWDGLSSVEPPQSASATSSGRTAADEVRLRNACTWTCGPDMYDAKICHGAVLQNGLVSVSDTRQAPTDICDAEACSVVFKDYGSICPIFELQSFLRIKRGLLNYGSCLR